MAKLTMFSLIQVKVSIYFQSLLTEVISLSKLPFSILTKLDCSHILKDYLISVGDKVYCGTLHLIMEMFLAVRTFLRLELIRQIIVLVSHKGIVLIVWVILPEGLDKIGEWDKIEGGVFKGFEFVRKVTFGDEV